MMDEEKQEKLEGSSSQMEGKLDKSEGSSSRIEVMPDEPFQVPKQSSLFASLSRTLDKVFPPHWSYLGFRRKPFLLAAAGIFTMLLALILGLAIGLGGAHGK
jgi:hypothetical protein